MLYSPRDLSSTSELISPDFQPDLLAQPLCQATKPPESKPARLQIIQVSQHHTSPFSLASVSNGRMRPGSSAFTGIMIPHAGFKDAEFILNQIPAVILPWCSCDWPVISLKLD